MLVHVLVVDQLAELCLPIYHNGGIIELRNSWVADESPCTLDPFQLQNVHVHVMETTGVVNGKDDVLHLAQISFRGQCQRTCTCKLLVTVSAQAFPLSRAVFPQT